MEEQHIDAMMEAIGCDATVGIPETRLHGILIANLLAHLNHLAPLHLAMIGARDVVHRHLLRTWLPHKLIRNDAQSIDGIVHRYHLRLVTRIDEHGTDDTFAGTNHQASWPIQIIHPAGYGFVGGG